MLALAVAGLVLIDPLLVHSLGFRLSVAASAGILLLARPLADALPLPGWLARPLGVTLAAQGAVAPLLVPVFGGMPVAAVPANLVAEPVAGLVMMWGCSGRRGGRPGRWPRRRRRAPADPSWAVVGGDGGPGRLPPCPSGAWVWPGWPPSAGPAPCASSVGASGVGPWSWPRRQPWRWSWPCRGSTRPRGPVVAGSREIGGATLWRGGGPRPAVVLVVPGDARAEGVLSGLRDVGVRRVDLVVLRSAGPKAAEVLAVVRSRVAVDWCGCRRAVPPPPPPLRRGERWSVGEVRRWP